MTHEQNPRKEASCNELIISWAEWSKQHERDLLDMYETPDENESHDSTPTYFPEIDSKKQEQNMKNAEDNNGRLSLKKIKSV